MEVAILFQEEEAHKTKFKNNKFEKNAKVKLLHLFGPSKNLIFKSDFRAITYHENLQKTVWSKIFLFAFKLPRLVLT